MPFIPHTKQDIHDMLATIGVAKIEDLFAEIPENLRGASLSTIAPGITEMELARLMKDRAEQDAAGLCFIGAGAYEHHIPAAVWEITGRGEFMTAYTPYQAEASQGTLQLLYEYQTMMASLMGLDVSNASLYDGASALAEAVLMALRANKHSKSQRILMPRNVHPFYRQVVQSIVGQQDIQLIEVPYGVDGKISQEALSTLNEDVAALVIPQPNFFGVFEEVDALTDWAHAHKALVIAVVNPLSMSFLKPPGEWGETGADIACGEGQSLGVPLASGGPYYGFLCCKQEFVRQLPGRIVGRTVDMEGKEGFVLTLQAREQHIRRAKATSNICTNQGLLVTASTIYMSLLGPHGLRNVALASYQNARTLRDKLVSTCGLKVVFDSPSFHEFVVQLPVPAATVLKELAKLHIQGGYDLSEYYPELQNCLLICVTETKANIDLDEYVDKLQFVLGELSVTTSFQKKNRNLAQCETGEA